MFLSLEELRTLTGYQRPTCMIRWLRENGFVFTVAADGYPRLLVEHVRTRLTGERVRKRTEPDLSALNSKG